MKRTCDRVLFSARGFTLLEVLVAMAIFAVIGIMAMSGYNELSRQSEHVTENMKRLRAVQMTIMHFAQDFEELEPRPVRDPLGSNSEPALLADTLGQGTVEFTRAGWSNPAAIQRSTLQRVAYRMKDGKLYRDHWAVLDRVLTSEPVEVEMLDKVSSLHFRFMDHSRTWSAQWPANPLQPVTNTPVVQGAAPAVNAVNLSDRPIAVEVTLELEDWGILTRLIEVPG